MSFPPKEWTEIFGYDDDEIVAGYREYRPDEPTPGANRSDGYRWGWANRKHDIIGGDDGYEQVRWAYIRNVPFFAEDVKH